MLLKRHMFNSQTVNIFTDASLKSIHGRVSVCPGYSLYIGDILVEQDFTILRDATVNQGELHAITMGIMAANRYRQFEHINLFSDSQTSIYAIRDRIFKWIQNTNNGNLIGTTGSISNQDYIMTIIYYILETTLRINLFHVKGHIKEHDYYELQRAKSVFLRSNLVNDNIDDEFIRQVCIGNNQIDRYTGLMLDMYINHIQYDTNGMSEAFTIGYAPFDTEQYKTLIGKKG